MKLLFTSLLLLAAFFVAHSSTLTPDQALGRLKASQDKATMAMRESADKAELAYSFKKAGRPLLYVFNKAGENGFMILPADDAVTSPLLGYTDKGSFDLAASSPDFVWWLGQYEAEILWAAEHPQRSSCDYSPRADRAEIDPIVQTYWNQLAPYNDLCPEYQGSRCPSGCVATAMAQVMKHWNYPERGKGQITYIPSEYIDYELSLDLSGIEFEWDKMLPRYDSNSSAESKKAVASLMYSCGVGALMAYGPEASSAGYEDSALALIRNFGYDAGMRLMKRDYFGIDAWNDLVYSELAAGRPVLYGGGNSTVAHAFVCDGYRSDGYFHINWGWGGWQDGYFKLSALNPGQSGVGGAAGGYNIEQEMIMGIRPPSGSTEIIPVLEFASDFSLDKNEYLRNGGELIEVSSEGGIVNATLSDLTLRFGLKLIDMNGAVTYLPSEQSHELAMGQSVLSYSVKASDFPAVGEFTVTPAVKSESGEWTDAYVMLDKVRAYTLKASETQLLFTPESVPTIAQDSLRVTTSIYPGLTCCIKAFITNLGDSEYHEALTPVLISGDEVMAEAGSVMIDLQEGESCAAEWISAFGVDVVPGNYSLGLMDNSGHLIGDTVGAVVKEAPTDKPEPYIAQVIIDGVPAMNSTLQSPVLAQLADFELTFTVGNRAGYFTDVVNGAVWYSETVGVKGLGGAFVGLDAGETAQITVSRNLSDLNPNHVYYLYLKGVETGVIGSPVFFKSAPESGIVSVDDDKSAFSVLTDGFEVLVAADIDVAGLTLFDATGSPVGHAAGAKLDVSGIGAGFYLVRVALADGTVKSSKLLISR